MLLHFGNAGAVDTCLSNAVTKMNGRRGNQLQLRDLDSDDMKTQERRANPMSALDGLESVDDFHGDMEQLSKCARVLQEQGWATDQLVQNYVFLGNPGTVREKGGGRYILAQHCSIYC